MNAARPASPQRGAALAVALFLLVIMTLLGLAAVRGSQIAVKMAGREQARLDASDSAQSLVDALLNNSANAFPVGPAQDVQVSCTPAGLALNQPPFYAPFACTTGLLVLPATPDGKYPDHSYLEIYRETDGSNTGVGAANSSRTRYARFRVTAGYDRTDEGLGNAEVTQGVDILIAPVAGMDLSSAGPPTTP